MRTIAAASLVLILACAHAREAEHPSSVQAATSEAQPDAEGRSQAPAQEQEPAAAEPGEKATAQKEGRIAGGGEDPSEIPVASSPSGLLKPGAEQRVRDKLGVKAGAGSLREALQKFQKKHDLPATGILDQRTVETLGLDPDDVFERASGR
jgi:Putative peptidoglycan binding domain